MFSSEHLPLARNVHLKISNLWMFASPQATPSSCWPVWCPLSAAWSLATSWASSLAPCCCSRPSLVSRVSSRRCWSVPCWWERCWRPSWAAGWSTARAAGSASSSATSWSSWAAWSCSSPPTQHWLQDGSWWALPCAYPPCPAASLCPRSLPLTAGASWCLCTKLGLPWAFWQRTPPITSCPIVPEVGSGCLDLP